MSASVEAGRKADVLVQERWLRQLVDSRSRIKVRMILTALLRSLTIGAAAYLGLEAFRRTAMSLNGTEPFTQTGSLSSAAATLLVALTWSLYIAVRRFPNLFDVAVLADNRYDLKERLASAYEVRSRTAPSEIEKALLHDAEVAASSVSPNEVAPLRLKRAPWFALAFLASALTVQLLPTSSDFQQSVIDGATLDTEESLLQTGAKVRRVSDLVGRQADVKSDPYLEAVSRSLADLGERIERGELERAQVDAELNRLLEHLSVALGEDKLSPGSNHLSSVDPSRSQPHNAIAMPGPQLGGGSQLGDRDPAWEGDGGEQLSRPPTPFSGERESLDDSNPHALDELLRRLEARLEQEEAQRSSAPMTPGNDNISADTFYGHIIPENVRKSDGVRQPSTQRANGQGEVPIGAADRSNEGEGDLAGEGTQELGRGAEDGFAIDELDVETLPLPLTGGEREPGKRIRLESPSDVEYRAVDRTPTGDVGGWQREVAASGSGYVIGMMDRDVVSRYFLPNQSQNESTER